jgi:hypothetical protein
MVRKHQLHKYEYNHNLSMSQLKHNSSKSFNVHSCTLIIQFKTKQTNQIPEFDQNNITGQAVLKINDYRQDTTCNHHIGKH